MAQITQKPKFDFQSRSFRVTKLIPDYNDILTDKRKEEQKHRQSNGLDIDDIGDFNNVINYEDNQKTFPKLQTIGWSHHSNNKFVPEYITPRSRLLATHSSRLNAAKYSEELRKQIEEKERIKAEEKERIRLEEEKLERKLDSERLKLLEEFEEEHNLLKQKAKQKPTTEEANKQFLNRDLMIGSTSPLSLLRSPTYRHMKESQPVSPVPRKSSAASRSLMSAMSETVRNTGQSMATQTSDEQKHITSEEYSDCESEFSTEDEKEEDDRRKGSFLFYSEL